MSHATNVANHKRRVYRTFDYKETLFLSLIEHMVILSLIELLIIKRLCFCLVSVFNRTHGYTDSYLFLSLIELMIVIY